MILSGVTPVCQYCRQFSSLVVQRTVNAVNTLIQSLGNASVVGQKVLAFTLGFLQGSVSVSWTSCFKELTKRQRHYFWDSNVELCWGPVQQIPRLSGPSHS